MIVEKEQLEVFLMQLFFMEVNILMLKLHYVEQEQDRLYLTPPLDNGDHNAAGGL